MASYLWIHKSSSAYKKSSNVNLNGSIREQLTAWAEHQLAEDAREIAIIQAGIDPAWSPTTELGLRYMGIARGECNKMVIKFNSKN